MLKSPHRNPATGPSFKRLWERNIFMAACASVVIPFLPNGGARTNKILPFAPSHYWCQVDTVMCLFYFPPAETVSDGDSKTKWGQVNKRWKKPAVRYIIQLGPGKSHAWVMHCLFKSSASLTGWQVKNAGISTLETIKNHFVWQVPLLGLSIYARCLKSACHLHMYRIREPARTHAHARSAQVDTHWYPCWRWRRCSLLSINLCCAFPLAESGTICFSVSHCF